MLIVHTPSTYCISGHSTGTSTITNVLCTESIAAGAESKAVDTESKKVGTESNTVGTESNTVVTE